MPATTLDSRAVPAPATVNARDRAPYRTSSTGVPQPASAMDAHKFDTANGDRKAIRKLDGGMELQELKLK